MKNPVYDSINAIDNARGFKNPVYDGSGTDEFSEVAEYMQISALMFAENEGMGSLNPSFGAYDFPTSFGAVCFASLLFYNTLIFAV